MDFLQIVFADMELSSKGLLDVDQQRPINQSPLGFGAAFSSVIAAAMNFEDQHMLLRRNLLRSWSMNAYGPA